MKKIISIIFALFVASAFVHSDELTDALKASKGKLVNVYLIYYTPVKEDDKSNSTWPFRGIIDSVTDKYLILTVEKADSVSNPYGLDVPGKVYIKIEQIAAVKIENDEVKKK